MYISEGIKPKSGRRSFVSNTILDKRIKLFQVGYITWSLHWRKLHHKEEVLASPRQQQVRVFYSRTSFVRPLLWAVTSLWQFHNQIVWWYGPLVFVTVQVNIHLDNNLFFKKKFGGKKSFLCGHWYPCFGLLVTCTLGGSLFACFIACMQQIPQIHLWCDTCWPLSGQYGREAVLST